MNRRTFLKSCGAAIAYIATPGILRGAANEILKIEFTGPELVELTKEDFFMKFIQPAAQALANAIDRDIMNELA